MLSHGEAALAVSRAYKAGFADARRYPNHRGPEELGAAVSDGQVTLQTVIAGQATERELLEPR